MKSDKQAIGCYESSESPAGCEVLQLLRLSRSLLNEQAEGKGSKCKTCSCRCVASNRARSRSHLQKELEKFFQCLSFEVIMSLILLLFVMAVPGAHAFSGPTPSRSSMLGSHHHPRSVALESTIAGWMSVAGYDQGYGDNRENDRDERASLYALVMDELAHRRGLSVSGVRQVIRKTKPQDLAARWRGWRRSCDCLLSLGFSAQNVTSILQGSSAFLHELDPEADIRRVVFYLWEDLGFNSWGKIGLGLGSWQRHKYKVVTTAPEVLRRKPEGGVEETVATLEQVGMPTKYILDASFRFPSLLNVPPSLIFCVSAYLSSTDVGFRPRDLGALYRRNPWLLHPRTVEQLRPVVAFLREELQVQRMHVVLRGYPQVVLKSVNADLQPRVVLLQSLGIPSQQIGCMVEAFPLLLSLPLEEQMLPVLFFFQAELGFSRHELWTMLRSFPAVLDLSLEENIRPVVSFLRDDVGLPDVKEFIKRLPPVLGYPVDWELRKKWALFQELGLDASDFAGFPGFVSYSLHDRLIPRLDFCRRQGVLAQDVVALRVVMAGGDAAFAKEFIGVDSEAYEEFLLDYKVRRKQARAAQTRADRESATSSRSWSERKKGEKKWGRMKDEVSSMEEDDGSFLFSEAVCD